MKIREGAYYRTRNGRVIGPMQAAGYSAEKWKFWARGFNEGTPCWTDEGRWSDIVDDHDMDLISEVYVSDTPPALEVETLRDRFAGRSLEISYEEIKAHTRIGITPQAVAETAYAFANAMMEARKK